MRAKRSWLPFIIPAAIGGTALIGLVGVGVAVLIARNGQLEAAAIAATPVGSVLEASPSAEALPPAPLALAGHGAKSQQRAVRSAQGVKTAGPEATGVGSMGAEGAGAPRVTPETPRPAAPPRVEVVAPTGERDTAARVFIHHRAGSVAARDTAERAAATARGTGFAVTGLRAVGATPSAPQVRFFHGSDAEAAARLARRLGPAWRARDFRHYAPSPRTGTLEVWVPGE